MGQFRSCFGLFLVVLGSFGWFWVVAFVSRRLFSFWIILVYVLACFFVVLSCLGTFDLFWVVLTRFGWFSLVLGLLWLVLARFGSLRSLVLVAYLT